MAEFKFYCCDCENIFDSEPDGTGYEQAPCPDCKETCMTSEFEGKATKKDESKTRFVVVAEFATEDEADPLAEKLGDAGLAVQITLPDVTEGDFFMGGNDNVCIMVPADVADQARVIIDS